jgi:hypothetical protein
MDSGREYEKLNSVRARAIELIRNAPAMPGNNLNAKAINFGAKVIQQLTSTTFAISTNSSSEARCSDNDMFVNANYPSVIFICGSTRTALSKTNNAIFLIAVQKLVHEGAHLVDHSERGYSSECNATYFELVIMENNFGIHNIPTMGNRDAYKSKCGFSEYAEIPSDPK